MNWREDYQKKLISIEAAAQLIKSGDTVAMGHAVGAPSVDIYNAILNRYEEVENVEILDVVQLRPCKLYDPEYMAKLYGRINHVLPFGVATIRKMYSSNMADYFPVSTGDSAEKIANRSDIAIVMVTPPNSQGYINLGVSNFYELETIRKGRASGKQRFTIAEVNDQMPIIYGNNWLHVSEIDYFVENSTPLPTFGRSQPTETEKIIAQYVLELIKDGDTIQMGIGGIPEAVVSGLEGKHDLGVITEMLPLGLPQLVEKGIVTNAKKPFHKGVTVATFLMGDQDLYEYARENPALELHPASYTNDPFFVAKHPNVVAMNMSLMVDLSGQIASEGLGHTQISGPGGQLDFMIGAYYSEGGRGITLINAAKAAKGALSSSIVPELPPGMPVTVPRQFSQYVISEFGIANLKYKTRRERALELIAISHPDLRGELRNSLKKNFYPQSGIADEDKSVTKN